ncbi:hypothetical protein [Pseudomonas japonica]|uniref:hypothetical protein n=1 Tax=Pseudomonas japonica TaxID=256466 RepID=UPI0015E34CC3|nr:hypothetical protein [Pseudomonas japonica]MBA1245713.1 hypothetical protein [Pseudomonas japonica]
MSRSTKNIQISEGINALQQILMNAIKRPREYAADIELRTALKTQASLSKFQCTVATETGDTLKTFPMSLNSLKTHADYIITGGYKALDDLRRKAIAAIEFSDRKTTRANKRSKSGLKLKLEELESELDILRQTNMILLSALSDALHQFSIIGAGTDSASRASRVQTASNSLRAIVSMNTPPFDQLTRSSPPPSLEVIDLNAYRDR